MVVSPVISSSTPLTLDEWLQNPPDRTEWVDGNLVEKDDMTLKHSRIQSNLSFYWRSYKNSSGQGGEVYTEVPCRTNKQGRSPDVAYLTPELVAQFGDARALPQSFPLIAEIISPTDLAEDMIAKTLEYLESGSDEVWLVYPEVRWVMIVTQTSQQIVVSGQVATQTVLPGFSVTIDELIG
jgi:Uma2 family endonuclease